MNKRNGKQEQHLSLWAGWLLDPRQRLVLVNDKGDDEEARRSLVRVGHGEIEGFLENGIQGWIEKGLRFTRTTQLSVEEIADGSRKGLILNVRNDKERQTGHIENAVNIPLGELQSRSGELPKQSTIIAVCGTGYRSSLAASLLAAQGFTDVSSMDGGMAAWRNLDLATVAA